MAWPTDRRPSDALTGELVPEIWSAKFIEHVMSYLPCIEVVNTEWRENLAKGDVLHIPAMVEIAASVVDVTVTAAIPSDVVTTITTTAETLTIDKWYKVVIQISDSVKKQTHIPNLLESRLKSASYAIEKVIDTDVNTLFSGLQTTGSVGVYGSDGQTFTDDILIALMEKLDQLDVPREDRALVGDPSTLADCYKIDKFMHFDYTSRAIGGMGGYRGTIVAYNLPMYTTNNLYDATTGSYGVLIHKEAIGLAIQMPLDVERDRVPSAASDLIYVRCCWGADELRDTFGYAFYTRKKS